MVGLPTVHEKTINSLDSNSDAVYERDGQKERQTDDQKYDSIAGGIS